MRLSLLSLLSMCVFAAFWTANALECYECIGSACEDLENVPVVSCNLDDSPETTTPDDTTKDTDSTTETAPGTDTTPTNGGPASTDSTTGLTTEPTTEPSTETTAGETGETGSESTESSSLQTETPETTASTPSETTSSDSTTAMPLETTYSSLESTTDSTGSSTEPKPETTDSSPEPTTEIIDSSTEARTEAPTTLALAAGLRSSRARRSLAAQAADQLIRNYRSLKPLERDIAFKTTACYSIEKNGEIQRGCVRIPQGESGCQAIRDKVDLPEDSVGDLCDVCQMDRCNGSANLRISLASLMLLLGLGLRSLIF